MTRIGTLVLGVCIAALTATAASAGAPPGSWYIAPSVNALWLDDERNADDDVGVTLAFGRTINENWDVELSVFGSDHDRAGATRSSCRVWRCPPSACSIAKAA